MYFVFTYLIFAAIILAIFFLLFWRLWFLRDPARKIPGGRNIVSPADGRIISILNVKNSDLRLKKGHLGNVCATTKDVARSTKVISIFMSPLDAHFNRAPAGGRIESIEYTKGKFFAAYNLEKSMQNEKNELVIKNRDLGKIKVIQVAGFLARRISCYSKINQNVIKGEKIGLISLGSQCILILPSKVRITVKMGEKVLAGTSIIGVY